MKVFLPILFFVVCIPVGLGQTVTIGEVETVESSVTELFTEVTSNPYTQSVYAVGEFFGDLTDAGDGFEEGVNNTPEMDGENDRHGMVVKYDVTGDPIWALKLGSPGAQVHLEDVTLDPFGDLYVVGWFLGEAVFEGVTGSQSFTLDAGGNFDGFVASFDTLGNLNWVKQLPGSGEVLARGIDFHADLGLAVCGDFGATLFVPGQSSLNGKGSVNSFLATLDLDGDFDQVVSMGHSDVSSISARSVAVYDSSIYITGFFESSSYLNFHTTGVAEDSVENNDDIDGFLAGYTSGLDEVLWAHALGGTDDDRMESVAADSMGVYCVGGITGEFTFPGGILSVDTENPNMDPVSASFDPVTGNTIWVREDLGSNSFDCWYEDVETNGAGAVYMTGFFNEDLALDKSPNLINSSLANGAEEMITVAVRPLTGDLMWYTWATSNQDDRGMGVTFDFDQNIHVAGFYDENVQFIIPSPLSAVGASNTDGRDAFLVQLEACDPFLLPIFECPGDTVLHVNPTGTCEGSLNALSLDFLGGTCLDNNLNDQIGILFRSRYQGESQFQEWSNGDTLLLPLDTTVVIVEAEDLLITTNRSCSFQVVVRDTVPPVFMPALDVSESASLDSCGATLFSLTPTLEESCISEITFERAGVSSSSGVNDASGLFYGVGVTQLTYEALDLSGNRGADTLLIEIADNQLPQVVCPDDTTLYSGEDCLALFEATEIDTTDNCGVTSILWELTGATNATGTWPLLDVSLKPGNTTLEYTVNDASGNDDSCSFAILVKDTIRPALNCPMDTLTYFTSADSCQKTVVWPTVTFSDNCVLSPTLDTLSSYPVGGVYELGVDETTLEVTDSAGNPRSCTFWIEVKDTIAPDLICPSDQFVSSDSTNCGKFISNIDAVEDGVCELDSSGYAVSGNNFSGLSAEAFFEVGLTEVEFYARDKSGNEGTCRVKVEVIDVFAPAIVPRNDTVVSSDAGVCFWSITDLSTAVADTCDPDPAINYEIEGGGTSFTDEGFLPLGQALDVGSYDVTYSARDMNGNDSVMTFAIRVEDQEPPELVCPDSDTLYTSSFSCSVNLEGFGTSPTDNCGPASLQYFVVEGNISPLAGIGSIPSSAVAFLGQNTIGYQAIDNNGLNSTCEFSVVVRDTVAPNISSCNGPGDLFLPRDTCAMEVQWDVPLGNDQCPVSSSMASLISGPVPGDVLGVGSYSVMYEYLDASNNRSTCNFSFTVSDTSRPDLVCPDEPLTFSANSNECTYTVPALPPSVLMDGCSEDTLFYTYTSSASDVITGQGSGVFGNIELPLGTIEVTYFARDEYANESQCTFSVEVEDVTAPVLDGLSDTLVISSSFGSCEGLVPAIEPTIFEACPNVSLAYILEDANGIIKSGSSGFSETLLTSGLYTLTFQAEDGSENMAELAMVVVVADEQAPVGDCPEDTVQCDSIAQYSIKEFTDNCSDVTMEVTAGPQVGELLSSTLNDVSLRFLDSSGNFTQCDFTIEIAPTPDASWEVPQEEICVTSDGFDLDTLVTGDVGGSWMGDGVEDHFFKPHSVDDGTHEVTYFVQPSLCSNSAARSITVSNDTILTSLDEPTLCGDSIALDLTPKPVSGGWFTDHPINFDRSTSSFENTLRVNAPGDYYLEWREDSVELCPRYVPVNLHFDAEPDSAMAGEDIQIDGVTEAFVSATSPSIGTGYWESANPEVSFDDPESAVTTARGLETGSYTLRWITQNGSCPTSIDTLIVFAQPTFIPEGFSPNDDGINDVFEILGVCSGCQVDLKVYNRWGNLVYESGDYQNDWDGAMQDGSEPLPADTYFYHVQIDGETGPRTGYVVVKNATN